MSPSSTSTTTRWSPTPEQLMILEEMYKGGLRTPNASQIQRITSHLSFYGKIEGKNVFYWFQNHKARDRQKLRRKLTKQLQQQQQQQQLLLQDHHHLLLHQYHQNSPHNSSFNVLSLVDPLPPPPPPSSPHLSHDHDQGPAQSLPQMDHHGPLNRQEISENYMNRSHSEDDWMMTKMTRDNDEEGTFPFPCCRAPLKTLQLFPITAPSLKDHHHQGTTTNV
ncbi:hypothetical protein M9H77_15989 [Catharanthus roseus]|uniref:Uncharacterized protein n=1 Tax=Catharanthus roseus TaxID=4058 RepID=A0ACC0B169_CATRO|nr:hypothetical protein M9H77_15989 [Catharanthus roseus]